jgi:peptide/nickel transport system permease protein
MEKETEYRRPKLSTRVLSYFKLMRKSKEATIGTIIVAIFIITALVVEVAGLLRITITPYDPLKPSGPTLAAPSLAHFFGTDLIGRDVFSRIIVATPNDVAVGFTVVAFALAVGLIVGSIAAFKGGTLDEILMRSTDVFFALPALIIAMVIAVALGPGVTHMMIALMIIWWPPYARLARGEALKVSHQNYIASARMSGMNTWRVTLRHVIPNTSTIMLVYATLDIGTVILVYSGLSYLGLSQTPPAPDWGEMISAFQDYLVTAPWLPLIPGLIIAAGVIGFSLLGDGMRDAIEAG